MSASDLSSHRTDFVQPISYTFGKDAHTVWECPPNGSGLAALMAFGILDALREEGVVDFESLDEGGAEWFHVLM
jgi:gamma-glutamyltranspeptidase/glutathione hydrolase